MMFKNRILLFLFALSLRYFNAVACATNLHDEILERSKILLIKDATADTTPAYNNTNDPLSSYGGDHENDVTPSFLTTNNEVINETLCKSTGTSTKNPNDQVTTDNTSAYTGTSTNKATNQVTIDTASGSTGTDNIEPINQVTSDPTMNTTTVQVTATTDNTQIDTDNFNSTNTSTQSILLEPSQAETSSTFWLYSSLFGFGIVGLAAVFGLIYHRMAKNMAKESMEV